MNFLENLKLLKTLVLSLRSFCLLLLKIHILFLMKHFINKLMVWPWVLSQALHYLMFFQYTMKKSGQNVVYSNIDQSTIKSTLIIYSPEHLKGFQSYLNSCHVSISYTLLKRCFWICSDWTKFYLEMVQLIDAFKSISYPENFINNCFKAFLDNKQRLQEKRITVPKKHLFLVLSYLFFSYLTTIIANQNQVKKIYQIYSELLQITDRV